MVPATFINRVDKFTLVSRLTDGKHDLLPENKSDTGGCCTAFFPGNAVLYLHAEAVCKGRDGVRNQRVSIIIILRRNHICRKKD